MSNKTILTKELLNEYVDKCRQDCKEVTEATNHHHVLSLKGEKPSDKLDEE